MISGYQGSYTVNITAVDNCNNPNACGDVGWQLFDVIVPNREPSYQFRLPDPGTVQLGVDTSFQYLISSDTVADPDGDPISWAAQLADGSALPVGMSFASITWTLSGIPVAGVYPIMLIASDGYGGAVNQTITLRVNSQPVVNMTDSQIILPGIRKSFVWTLPATAMIDADGDALTYELVNNDPRYLVPSWLSFNGAALTGTPTSNSHRPIPLLIRGKDAFGGVGELPVSLVISNFPPVEQISLTDPEITQVGDDISYTFPVDTFIDPEGDSLQYRALLNAGNGTLPSFLRFNPITRTLSGKSTTSSAGRYSVIFQADDGYGGVVNGSAVLIHVNTEPRVDLVLWKLMADGIHKVFTATMLLTAIIDADGDQITYELVTEDPRYLVPAWLSFNGTTLTGTPDNNQHQAIQLLIKGRDPFGGVGELPVSLTIKNTVPVLQVELPDPETVQLGDGREVAYAIQSDAAIDVDGDAVTWTARLSDGDALPMGLSFSPVARQLTGLPEAGVYPIKFTAIDGYGGVINQTVVLRVNSQPVAKVKEVFVSLPGIYQSFTWSLPAGLMTDADGDSIPNFVRSTIKPIQINDLRFKKTFRVTTT